MSDQPTRLTRTKQREFQATRQQMKDYVEMPTAQYSGYAARLGWGASLALIGLVVLTQYQTLPYNRMIATLFIACALPYTISGLSGMGMQLKRLEAYFWDILDRRRTDVEEETIHYDNEPAVPTVRPLAVKTGNKVKTTIEVDDPDAKFTRGHLEAFAVSVLCRKSGMTKDGVTKQTINSGWQYRKISQPMWTRITDWMVAQKPQYATKDSTNHTELTATGYDWLMGYVPEHETIYLARPK